MKTNALRLLESKDIEYNNYSYDPSKGVDGLTCAEEIGKDPALVYKTLLGQGALDHYVFIIPVAQHLDYKKAAKFLNEKSIKMAHLNELGKLTGYERGACSPIGMKRQYKTIIDSTAKNLDTFIVSAGKVGMQIEIKPEDLAKFIDIDFADLIE